MQKQKTKKWDTKEFYVIESTRKFADPVKVSGLIHKSGIFGIHSMSTVAFGHCVVHIPSKMILGVCSKGKAARNLIKDFLRIKMDFGFENLKDIDKDHLIEIRRLIKYWQKK